MPNYSLLFARTLQHADNSALIDWKWERSNELRNEYHRPDTRERVRYVHDDAHSLQNLRWNTRVYLGAGWKDRRDAPKIRELIASEFFKEVDPLDVPPPRPRKTRDDRLRAIEQQLKELKQ